jgi:hypothetical protein
MKFSDLVVGDNFKYKDTLYQKIQAEKISCCRSLNAVNVETNQKVMIKPIENVEKVTSDNK